MEKLLHIQEKLEKQGAEFCLSITKLAENALQWNVFLWDWDGVFNSGYKTKEQSSGFSEADSMGVNMLRFGYWLKNGKMPFVAIITGEENPTAIHFAQREHFDAICLKFSHKTEAFEILQKKHNLDSQKVAFVFDDILDVA
ncbi:MAG: phosphatase, partial [Raineya sp.]|nr:phosphatase [Raineya sp.]